MEKAIFFIVLGICLIELVVIFALLDKKKPMHVATLIAITFGIVGLIRTYQDRNLIFKHSEKNISQIEQNNNDNKNMLIKKLRAPTKDGSIAYICASGLGENDRVTSGQVQAPQIPEMELIKEDYHPIKFIIEMVKSIFSNKRTN